jgi:hypothetical protein
MASSDDAAAVPWPLPADVVAPTAVLPATPAAQLDVAAAARAAGLAGRSSAAVYAALPDAALLTFAVGGATYTTRVAKYAWRRGYDTRAKPAPTLSIGAMEDGAMAEARRRGEPVRAEFLRGSQCLELQLDDRRKPGHAAGDQGRLTAVHLDFLQTKPVYGTTDARPTNAYVAAARCDWCTQPRLPAGQRWGGNLARLAVALSRHLGYGVGDHGARLYLQDEAHVPTRVSSKHALLLSPLTFAKQGLAWYDQQVGAVPLEARGGDDADETALPRLYRAWAAWEGALMLGKVVALVAARGGAVQRQLTPEAAAVLERMNAVSPISAVYARMKLLHATHAPPPLHAVTHDRAAMARWASVGAPATATTVQAAAALEAAFRAAPTAGAAAMLQQLVVGTVEHLQGGEGAIRGLPWVTKVQVESVFSNRTWWVPVRGTAEPAVTVVRWESWPRSVGELRARVGAAAPKAAPAEPAGDESPGDVRPHSAVSAVGGGRRR